MIADAATAALILTFLSIAIERGVEVVMATTPAGATSVRRLAAIGLSLAFAAAIAFGLGLDLVSALLEPGTLTGAQGRALTAIALAGGSAPAHELLRLIEEAKLRVKA